jgi:hypothetical protein
MIDPFAITYEVAKHWLPTEEQSESHQSNVMRALSRSHVTDPNKSARRLTTGWIIATSDGGHHKIKAAPLRPFGNSIAYAESIEEVIGDQSIQTPTVIVKLAKAGLTSRNFQPSYGDTLRINEAGKPVSRIDLANVRRLTTLVWRTKPSAKWIHQARRALAEVKFGSTEQLERLARPPFDDPPEHVLPYLEAMCADDISYAIAVLIKRRSA